MSQTYELAAARRERTGKGAARATRREGMTPGVIYGGGEPPVSIKVDYRTLDARIRGGGFLTTVATIDVEGSKIRVLPRDYQLDPVQDTATHVDFLRVKPGTQIKVDVPVRFINESAAPGIKRGGVLNIVRHTIELICSPESIPGSITDRLDRPRDQRLGPHFAGHAAGRHAADHRAQFHGRHHRRARRRQGRGARRSRGSRRGSRCSAGRGRRRRGRGRSSGRGRSGASRRRGARRAMPAQRRRRAAPLRPRAVRLRQRVPPPRRRSPRAARSNLPPRRGSRPCC